MAGGSQRRSSRRARPDALGAADAHVPTFALGTAAQLTLEPNERLELYPGAFQGKHFGINKSLRDDRITAKEVSEAHCLE